MTIQFSGSCSWFLKSVALSLTPTENVMSVHTWILQHLKWLGMFFNTRAPPTGKYADDLSCFRNLGGMGSHLLLLPMPPSSN